MRRLRWPSAESDSRRDSPSRATTCVEVCSSSSRRPPGRARADPAHPDSGRRPARVATDAPPRAALHGCTVTMAEPVRPKTSGSYISSTCVGAVRKVPEVVARATWVKLCSPSESRVAKSSTRSSWRSTRSKPPRRQKASRRPRRSARPGPREVGGGGREPGLDGLEPRGQRIGDRNVAALLGEAQRQRHADEVAGLERRERPRPPRPRRGGGSVGAARCGIPGRARPGTRRVRRVLQARGVEERARRPVAAQRQVCGAGPALPCRPGVFIGTSAVCAVAGPAVELVAWPASRGRGRRPRGSPAASASAFL